MKKQGNGNILSFITDLMGLTKIMTFIFFLIILLLFNYSYLYFLPILHPIQTHLPPLLPPSPLVLSLCPL